MGGKGGGDVREELPLSSAFCQQRSGPQDQFFSVDVIFLSPSLFFLNKNTGARLTRGPQELSIRGMKYSESLIFLGDL